LALYFVLRAFIFVFISFANSGGGSTEEESNSLFCLKLEFLKRMALHLFWINEMLAHKPSRDLLTLCCGG
jgi:hypothetical protein